MSLEEILQRQDVREVFAQQLQANAREVVAFYQNRTNLRRHIAGLFMADGGVEGFAAWAKDIANDLGMKQLQDAMIHGDGKVRVEVDEDDDGEAILHHEVRAPEAPLSVVGEPVRQPPPPPPPPQVDVVQLVDARLAQFQAALPATVEAIVRQVMPRPSLPLPLNLPPVPPAPQTQTVGPYDRNARPAFAPNLGWPHNTR